MTAAVHPPFGDPMSEVPPIREDESPAETPRSRWATALAVLGLGTAEGAGGLGVSLAVHGGVLLAMALWAIDLHGTGSGLMLSVTPGTEESAEIELIDTQWDKSGGSPLQITAPPLELFAEDAPGMEVEVLTASAGGVSEGTGAGTGEGDGDGDGANPETIQLPGGGTAIRKGSFTVWTVPPDPRPMQDYAIVIEVDLPEKLRLRRYPKHDLYGMVKGTDDFLMRLPGNSLADRRGFLPIRDGKVQFVVGIPGAESLVKDRITVGSKLLNESQTLELVF
ncbi:3'-5' exonuclease family protein [Alienimonas californiensis]|uniref:Uncharacterized protein n=1 Tax=Alienimonas californiensis TaxID=2527989 RepID=A0A517PDN1_9PLAN|nr:hypothetical protein [Alienimonas californiensis]QDT17474.1 hypothetical protein CA12_35990 [Alienimonas californiensis]